MNKKSEKGSCSFCIETAIGRKDTLQKNICNKLSDIPCKYINKELKKLYKDEFIRFKKTNHRDDVFLNIKKKKEIEIEIKNKLEMLYDFN